MNHLPPGPGSALRTTLEYMRDPYATLLDARRHGDPHGWPTFFGNMVVTGDPAGVRALFSADPDTFLALGAELLGPVIGESNLPASTCPSVAERAGALVPPLRSTR